MDKSARELAHELAEARRRNQEAFIVAYQALAAEYGCDFAPQAYIADDGRIAARIVVIDNETL